MSHSPGSANTRHLSRGEGSDAKRLHFNTGSAEGRFARVLMRRTDEVLRGGDHSFASAPGASIL